MATDQRINSTDESGESVSWVPAADFIVQGQVLPGSRARVEIHARLTIAAPWVKVETIRLDKVAFMVCRKMPEVKLVWSGNSPGDPIRAWSAE